MVDTEIESQEVESQEVTDSANPSDSAAEVTSEQLAQNPEIAAVFERVFGKGDVSDDDGEEAEATPEDGGEEAAEPADEAEGSEEPAPAPKTIKAAPTRPGQEATATLNPALQQAAKRAGWNEADIAEFHAANPELAEKTFANLQGSHNELSRRFAQLGQQRTSLPANQPAVQPVTTVQPQAPANGKLAALEAAYKNLPEFAQNNGEELAKVVKDLFEGVVQPFQQMQAHLEAQQRQATAFQVHQQFDGLKDFADLYGASGKLSPEQHHARFAVATLADQIRAGGSLQGIDMPINEALEAAHNLHTADRVKQTARQQVQQQVVNRAKRISNRPTQRRTPATAADGGQRSEASAMRAISSWWAERGVDA